MLLKKTDTNAYEIVPTGTAKPLSQYNSRIARENKNPEHENIKKVNVANTRSRGLINTANVNDIKCPYLKKLHEAQVANAVAPVADVVEPVANVVNVAEVVPQVANVIPNPHTEEFLKRNNGIECPYLKKLNEVKLQHD
jgi:hypothetical protein